MWNRYSANIEDVPDSGSSQRISTARRVFFHDMYPMIGRDVRDELLESIRLGHRIAVIPGLDDDSQDVELLLHCKKLGARPKVKQDARKIGKVR